MAAAKKHHYVPVFYQKGFTDSEGLLWVYDRKLKTWKRLHPKVVCRAEDLYAVKRAARPKDRRIETDILSPIEGATAPIIQRIDPKHHLTDYAIEMLAFFIGLQATRLPSFGRMVSVALEASVTQLAKAEFANVERATHSIKQYEAATGEEFGFSPASMVDSILNSEIRFVATERPFLQQMFAMAMTLRDLITESEWTFLVAPQPSGFITCDHPFTTVPPRGFSLDGMGIGPGLPGVVNYFPINERYCLRLVQKDGFTIRFENVDSRAVRIVNRNLAANSERFIMASNEQQLDSIVKSSGTVELDATERFSVETVVANENESLLKYTVHPRRYFYFP